MIRPQPIRIIAEALLLAGIFLGVWFGVYSLVPKDWSYKPRLSFEDEKKLGDILIDSYLQGEQRVTDPEALDMIYAMGNRLQEQIPNSQYNYTFYIVKSPVANAFTLPGGNIVIFSGLIELADTPEELAGVLGHEMGHAENRHVVDRLIKEFGITAIGAIVLGDKGGMIGGLLQKAISTSFDRDQEREADDFALKTLVSSGINPKYFGDFFSKLDKESSVLENGLEMISTHPDNGERIAKARNYKLPAGFTEKPFTADEVDLKKLKELVQ
ncbi:MAG: M48 family metallopeptidase [Sphingobacteriales bacterium JAD_PAG50586_3]|nr:MAG: M48 family metallopeptidase [Sphingobacteriales bacterium JAD_PAG50586_3]